jgi:branched-chain amino acid transport system substrate-binding protein
MLIMLRRIKTALIAGAAIAAFSQVALAADVKVALIGGITGPIESLAPPIIAGGKYVFQQVNEQGGFWKDGTKADTVVLDATCADATKAADAGDRAVNVDKVLAINGGHCSGATIAIANNAAIPGGVLMISPASTSPAVTGLKDNDLVFRTVTSDAYQGEVLAHLIISKGVKNVAVTYVNNDYGKGFADSFDKAFKELGGTVAASQAHEDGKADYRAEIGNLSATGADALVVLAYADGSGQTILRQALEGGDFDKFYGGDGMVAASLIKNVPGIEGKITFTKPSTPSGEGRKAYEDMMKKAGLNADGTFVANSYDASFIIAMAIEKAGSADRAKIAKAVREVTTGEGETVLPGDWNKAKELIDAGKAVKYEGATGLITFVKNGDVPGVYHETVLADGGVKDLGLIKMQ